MTYSLEWEDQALAALSGFLDDPAGLRGLLDALDRLGDEPRPPNAGRVGSDDRIRIRAGRYRAIIEIIDDDKCVHVVHVGRLV